MTRKDNMSQPKIIELPTKRATPLPRNRCNIKTIEDVRRELSKVYREARANLLDISDASKLANILSLAGRVIEGSNIEARIKALEDAKVE
jgi:hypothetical protein